MGPRGRSTIMQLLVGLLAVSLFSGCFSSSDVAPGQGSNEPSDEEAPGAEYEVRVTKERVESFDSPLNPWNNGAWIDGVGEGPVYFSGGFTLDRPEHLQEAHFIVNWTAASQDVFDELRVSVTGIPRPFAVTGTQAVEVTIDGTEWEENSMNIRPEPWSSSSPVAVFVDFHFTIDITWVEHVPVA